MENNNHRNNNNYKRGQKIRQMVEKKNITYIVGLAKTFLKIIKYSTRKTLW